MDILKTVCGIGLVWATIGSNCGAQTQFAGTRIQSRSNPQPQMKVIEVVAQPERDYHFTIAGAVNRSGVFTAETARISIDQLIKAANGITGSERPSLRVIRGGQSRYSFTYDPHRASQAFVQENDIVIVLPRPGDQITRTAIPVIPVVCVGLQERPVVLPLSPEVRTLSALLSDLNQSPDLATTIRVLDPFARRNTQELAPGSVVFFSAGHVDRQALARVNQFPPVVPLMETEQETTAVPVSDLLIPEANPSVAEQLPLVMEKPLAQPETVANPPPLFTSPEQPQVAIEEPLMIAETAVAVGHVEALPIPSVPELATTPRIDGTHPIQFSAPPASTIRSGSLPVGVPDLPLISDEERDAAVTNELAQFESFSGTAPLPPETNYRETAPVPTPMATIEPVRTESEPRPVPRDTSQDPVTAPVSPIAVTEAPQQPASSEDAILPIAIAVGTLGLICLAVSIFWSMRDRLAEQHQDDLESTALKQLRESDDQATPEQSEVARILNRSMPVIQEEVVLPSEISFHGEPVGQRRLIVHERHEALTGPHFGRKGVHVPKRAVVQSQTSTHTQSSPEETVSETDYSPSVDAASDQFEPREQRSPNDSTGTVLPVPQVAENEFDVVTPQPAPPPMSGSALERALRILAKEKK